MYSWNFTIDDSSSMLNYLPAGDAATLNSGWLQWYSGYAGNFIKKPGDDSSGTSLHITATPGASIAFQFVGTAVYLRGTANCSYSIVLDSTQYAPDNTTEDMLFFKDGLLHTTHFLNLTASPQLGSGEQLAFDGADVTDVINDNVNNLIPIVFDNQNQTALQYSGNWTTQKDPQIPSLADPKPFMETADPEATVSVNFTNAVAVAVNANRNWGHWLYNVSLDGAQYEYNASTWWLIGNALLFYQSGLDPNETHSLTLTNMGTASYFALTLNDITVYKPNSTDLLASPASSGVSAPPTTSGPSPSEVATSTDSHKHVNVGAIVGPILAVVIVALTAVIAFLWWRRKRETPPAVRPFEPEMTVMAAAAPFPRGGRPDIWYKGMVDAPQPVTVVVPATGKRAQMESFRVDTGASGNGSGSGGAGGPEMEMVIEDDAALSPAPPPRRESPSAPASASARTDTSVNESVVPPSTATTPSSARSRSVDVNQIIELIAQRIDPAPRRVVSGADSDAPPPRYPA